MAADILAILQGDYVLTILDYYTRLARAIKLRDKTAVELKKALEQIFNEIGTPETLVTDNGGEFVAKETQE